MDMDEKIRKYAERICPDGRFSPEFGAFYELLTEYNGRYNLTAITEEKEVFYKHFLDSAAGEFLFPENGRVLEVGSGAGFPSLAVKILRPDLSFTLVESVGKKCEFLRTAVKELGLDNVTVYNGRAETLARDEAHREGYDVVCARAVARLNVLSEYCVPFVRKGGVFVAYKSGDGEELREAKRAFTLLGCRLKENIVYSLPEGYGERSLIVAEKVSHTSDKYPRGNGKERKQPL